ncbi:response regulator [Desulfothermus okinawensis JCM 13304]
MNKKVLVVDDAPTVRKYHQGLLEKLGIDTDEAINGMEALEKILKEKVALVFVDINMPVMDGYSFLKEMRSNEEISDIPAIMVSTESDVKDKIKAYESGANYYLVKPVKPHVLESIVRGLLGNIGD